MITCSDKLNVTNDRCEDKTKYKLIVETNFNFMNLTKEQIHEKYLIAANTPSDINQHLPTLLKYANLCEHITEMGVRGVVSTWAFLESSASKVIAIDILNVAVPEVRKLTFICADDLQIEIEPTDMLFVDTRHCYVQCIQELNLHAKNVRKFIAFHDTNIFGEHGDDGGKGLNYAINEFMKNNSQWSLEFVATNNNGLTIIKRNDNR